MDLGQLNSRSEHWQRLSEVGTWPVVPVSRMPPFGFEVMWIELHNSHGFRGQTLLPRTVTGY